jgi:sulfonate transport system substrate-binding protein
MTSSITPRVVLSAGLPAAWSRHGNASPILRVGDHKGGAKSLMTASGGVAGFEHLIEWSIFVAGAPLPDALKAEAIDCGGVGASIFAFARAAGVRSRIYRAHAFVR